MRVSEPFVANVPKRFYVVGNYFKLKAASDPTAGATTIDFYSGSRKLNIDLSAADAGDWARSYPDGFDMIEIVSTVSQTLAFQVLRGEVGSDRFVGTVGITSSGSAPVSVESALAAKAFTVTGKGYMGGGGSALVAGQRAVIQLWNNIVGGTRFTVDDIHVSSSIAGAITLAELDAIAATTLLGQLASKMSNVADSTTLQVRYANQVGSIAGLGSSMFSLQIAANSPLHIPLKTPIVVEPGRGIAVQTAAVASDVFVAFQGRSD